MEISSDDPEDSSSDSEESFENGSTELPKDPDDKAAEETSPEIRSILDESSSEDESDEELTPPPDNIWYDSLDELQAAIQKHAIQHGYSVTIKRGFIEKEKKNFQCDRGYKGKASTKKNPYHNNHTH